MFSVAYAVAPHSRFGQTMRKPFIKFICHSASYFTFLCEYKSYREYGLHKSEIIIASHARKLVIELSWRSIKTDIVGVFVWDFQKAKIDHE